MHGEYKTLVGMTGKWWWRRPLSATGGASAFLQVQQNENERSSWHEGKTMTCQHPGSRNLSSFARKIRFGAVTMHDREDTGLVALPIDIIAL